MRGPSTCGGTRFNKSPLLRAISLHTEEDRNEYSGLTVEFARKIGAAVIIRGIRAVSDYEYELGQATANMMLAHEIETAFLIAKPQYSFLSSSVCKEIALNGGDLLNLVPPQVEGPLKEKMAKVAENLKAAQGQI